MKVSLKRFQLNGNKSFFIDLKLRTSLLDWEFPILLSTKRKNITHCNLREKCITSLISVYFCTYSTYLILYYFIYSSHCKVFTPEMRSFMLDLFMHA